MGPIHLGACSLNHYHETSTMSYSSRLGQLRTALAHRELDGFVIAWEDEHLSEYVDSEVQRLAWISSFQPRVRLCWPTIY